MGICESKQLTDELANREAKEKKKSVEQTEEVKASVKVTKASRSSEIAQPVEASGDASGETVPKDRFEELEKDAAWCLDTLDRNLEHRKKEFAALERIEDASAAKLRSHATDIVIESGVYVIVFDEDNRDVKGQEHGPELEEGEEFGFPAKLVRMEHGMAVVAISYRHCGPTCTVKLMGGGGETPEGSAAEGSRSFEVNANAVKALRYCMVHLPKGTAIWLDLVSIPGSGHTLHQAFAYMGSVYIAFKAFSQIHWERNVQKVRDYCSRGWIMQEFLVAEQLFTESLLNDIVVVATKAHECGKEIIQSFRLLLSSTAHSDQQLGKLSKTLSENVAAYDALAETMEAVVLQFWTNDQHKFWLQCCKELVEVFQQHMSDNSHQASSHRFKFYQHSTSLAKRCMCPPKLCLIKAADVDHVMGMMQPTTNVLGRLEYCFISSSLFAEADRPTAIFGVYNALRETETPVHGCSFGGIWPSLRGVQVQNSVGSSGLSRDFPMLATAISAEIDVALSFLYASGGMAGGRNQGRARRRSTLLGSAKEAKVAALEETETRRLVLHCLHKRPQGAALCKVIWTYSSLVGEGADPVADLQQAMVFAEEIDVHFSLPNGTIRALFETFANVTGATKPRSRKVGLPDTSFYSRCLQFGDHEIIVA